MGQKNREAAFEFKCRRCGTVVRNPHTSEANGLIVLISVITGQGSPQYLGGASVNMHGVHACEDEGHGVTDLIGYAITKSR